MSYQKASKMLANKLSILPANKERKCPLTYDWKIYQGIRPNENDLREWFLKEKHSGICIITGRVSDNLELIDFDQKAKLFHAWSEEVKKNLPELFKRLVIESTQSGGKHVVYRVDPRFVIPKNQKLAQEKIEKEIITYIETRGEGGLFLCDFTDGYKLEQNDFLNIPTISIEERDYLIDLAKFFNKYEKPKKEYTKSTEENKDLPGSIFNRSDSAHDVVEESLKNHGWTKEQDGVDCSFWIRPGKKEGRSASLHTDGSFWVFSTSTEFEVEELYSPFATYAMLEHDGNFKEAAKELVGMGYLKIGEGTKEYVPLDIPEYYTDKPSNDEVYNLLKDEPLGRIERVFASQMDPCLPLELSLPQSMSLISAALTSDKLDGVTLEKLMEESAEREITEEEKSAASLKAHNRLRVYIADGKRKLALNLAFLIVAPSTSGKNIGDLIDKAGDLCGLRITSGCESGQGFYDELIDNGNLILNIDELGEYFNPNSSKHGVIKTFTEIFYKGWFDISASKRNAKKYYERKSNFAFPTFIGFVQNRVLERICGRSNIDDGFLGRTLITQIQKLMCNAPAIEPSLGAEDIVDVLKIYKAIRGPISVPKIISKRLQEMSRFAPLYLEESAAISFRRIFPASVYKFGTIISGRLNPSLEQWEKAIRLGLWFFHQSLDVFGSVGTVQDKGSEMMESLKEKILDAVDKFERKNKKPATLREIKRLNSIGSKFTKKNIDLAIEDLLDQELIQSSDVRHQPAFCINRVKTTQP